MLVKYVIQNSVKMTSLTLGYIFRMTIIYGRNQMIFQSFLNS